MFQWPRSLENRLRAADGRRRRKAARGAGPAFRGTRRAAREGATEICKIYLTPDPPSDPALVREAGGVRQAIELLASKVIDLRLSLDAEYAENDIFPPTDITVDGMESVGDKLRTGSVAGPPKSACLFFATHLDLSARCEVQF